MVNLFSFGCHGIDRAYVGVYRLQGWGRGDYLKGGRGVSVVSWQVHILYIGHSQYGQLTAVRNRIATDQYHMTILRAYVSTNRGDVIYLEAVR